MKLGLSGLLTRAFINSPLTPLLLLAAIVAGALALSSLPREEEPQISVPMVDIIVQANGYKADQAVELVTRPLEDIIKGIDGVEHVYSQTGDDLVVVTARFLVGTDQDSAITRVHEKIRAHIGELPKGIPEPLIIGRGINDVAIVDLTLSARPDHAGQWSDNALFQVAEELQHELTKVNNVGSTYIVGGSPNQIRVEPDPERLAVYGVTLSQLIDKLTNANRSFLVGAFRVGGKSLPVLAGQTLQGVPDIGLLLLTTRDGRPVYVKDVADVTVGAAEPEHRAWTIVRLASGELQRRPAVTIAVAKRKGSNAVVVAEDVMRQLDAVKGRVIPADLEVSVTRNYGATASEKANELLFHLALATVSIVVLITIAVGWREGLVVLIVIPTTILLTLFASWLMGYTINRVSLFALIFSIGILVDDAIVIVENIARHWAMNDGRNRSDAAIEAVAEVGNPTIVATLTIIAALLPMMFVSGMMGPYMSPIPANASIAMLFSFFIAVTVTPWLLLRFTRTKAVAAGPQSMAFTPSGRWAASMRRSRGHCSTAASARRSFCITVGAATLAACTLFYTEAVRVKLLPFDNKSEIQVVLDLPHGATIEDTDRMLMMAAERLKTLPELVSIQAYSGTASPFNFNGLVRHYYLRENPEQGDLSINLLPKGERSRASHAIALDIRRRLADLPLPDGSALKVVEVPPGPPVLATLLAEVYGPDAADEARHGSENSQGLRVGRFHRRRRRQLRQAVGPAALLDRSGGARIPRRGGAGGLRHDRRARRRRKGRLFPARRGPEADRHQREAPEERNDPRRTVALNSSPCGGTVRQGANVELGDVVKVSA